MAHVIADRVRETSVTAGTGSITLAGGVYGFRSFASNMSVNDTCWYTIQAGAQWEVGLGTLTAASVLARTTVYASSNNGALVNFAAGTKDVMSHIPADAFTRGYIGIPPGTPLPFLGSTAPPGTLLPFGQNVSRTTFARLFAVYGTKYGAGDGVTTFGMPDARGRAFFGRDDMGGAAANRITSAISGINGLLVGAAGGDQRMHKHSHSGAVGIDTPTHSHTSQFGSRQTSLPAGSDHLVLLGTGAGSQQTVNKVSGGTDNTHAHVVADDGAGASQNMPPAMICDFVIWTGNIL